MESCLPQFTSDQTGLNNSFDPTHTAKYIHTSPVHSLELRTSSKPSPSHLGDQERGNCSRSFSVAVTECPVQKQLGERTSVLAYSSRGDTVHQGGEGMGAERG